MENTQKGTIKWFSSEKGYGFIQPEDGNPDIFVHISDVKRAGYTILNNDQVVSYEIDKAHRLKLKSQIN